MSLIGYGRVSSADQSLTIQMEALEQAGCDRIFAEKVTGTSMEVREQFQAMERYLREGDVLLVTRLDRLARSLPDLVAFLGRLGDKGVGLRCLQQGLDTTSIEGRLMIHILGAFAEFETAIRRERQREGIDKAKALGVYARNKKKCLKEDIAVLKAQGMGASLIAAHLNVDRKTVYRHHPEGWGELPQELQR